jgi:hypothetical protein
MTGSSNDRTQSDEAYRAIGRYVYCFSRLIYWMRSECENAVGNQHLAQILCGDMAADQIQRAFFGICNERYTGTEEDKRIGKAIRKKVIAAIEFRNSLSHGDWLVGVHDGDGTTYPPELSRVRPGSSTQWTGWQLTPDELDEKSDELESLRHDVHYYGSTAGGILSTPWEGVRGAITPSDVFVMRDGVAVRDGKVKFDGYVS